MRKILVTGIGIAAGIGLFFLLKSNQESSSVVHEPATAPERTEKTVSGLSAEPVKEGLSGPEEVDRAVQQCSGAVQTVIDPDAGYRERLEAMRELGYEMSAVDIEVLMDFLNQPIPEDAKLSPLSYNSVRNDTYIILLRQKELPERMGELLIKGYNNPEMDEMWRNYCIQFMQPYYEKQLEVLSAGSKQPVDNITSSKELTAVRDSLWDALGERNNSNAGTALLALDKLSRNHEEFVKEDIDAAMLNLAQDKSATVANRVTAIRLCGEHQNVQALETARDLAQNADVTMLRCAAIATLGEIGTEEDLVLLEALSASRDKRIARIASASLDKRVAE